MKIWKSAAVAFSFFVLVAFAVVFVNKATHHHERFDNVSLRLQWIHQAQFAGFYVAKEKGFYEKRGVHLTIRSGGIGFNAPLLVAQEKDDFGIWVADQVLAASAKEGMPIRAIGTVYNKSLACFMVRDQSGILTPADFAGKTVGIYHGFDTETIFQELIARFHVNASKVKQYTAAYNMSPFLDGQVDVWPSYVINEPLAAEENGVKVRVLTPDAFGIRYYSDTLIVNERILREKRDLVIRFLEASEEGWRYALSNIDEAVDLVLKYDSSLKRDHEKRMLLALVPYLNSNDPLFGMDPNVWQSMSEILLRQGAINDVSSFKTLCDFSVADEAHRARYK